MTARSGASSHSAAAVTPPRPAWRYIAAWAALLLLPCTSSTTAAAQECSAAAPLGTCRPRAPRPKCGVYMAPSTLGQDTNMGIYTGTNLRRGDLINFPEIAIPLLFREWSEHKTLDHAMSPDGELWDRYIWEGPIMELEPYNDLNREDSRAVFVPGVGCTVNSVLDMNNIESTHGSIHDVVGLHRARDPGAGAFAPYRHAVTDAVTDVVAGSELFASYGDFWIPSIPGAQITFNDVMNTADEFLTTEYDGFVTAHAAVLSDRLKQGLWDFTKHFPIYSQMATVLPRANWSAVETELRKEEREASLVRKFVREQSVRTIDWLDEHGYCQDHIRPGNSTIPQAGRGAFATRDLPAGTIVGYSPLVHMGLHGRELFDIEYPDGRHAYDLVINYSFGHKNSSVLLTPYGGMVNYINHDQYRANVKIQWPSRELIAHKPHWLTKTPLELRDTLEKIGLSFEYVALRDIAEGEEVLMDYGDEWQAAWDAHVASWTPVPDAERYVHRSDWTETTWRTAAEREVNAYPSNLITICSESFTIDPATEQRQWMTVLRPSPQRVYCDVLTRQDPIEPGANHTYTVAMHLTASETEEEETETVVEVRGVPHHTIELVDAAFSGDWHLPNVFRHEIMIPDDVMPPSFQNGPSTKPF